MNITYNCKRVHKVNFITTQTVILFFIVKSLLAGGFTLFTQNLIYSLPVAVLATVAFLIPISDFAKGLSFGMIPTLTTFALFFVNNYALDKHYTLFVALTMVALYFNSRLLLTYGVLLNILYIGASILSLEKVIGDIRYPLNMIVSIILMMDGALLIL